MTTIEQIIANFKGTTFSSHEDVEKWLRQALKQVRKDTIEECEKAVVEEDKTSRRYTEFDVALRAIKDITRGKWDISRNNEVENIMAFKNGFNACRSETLANLNKLKS